MMHNIDVNPSMTLMALEDMRMILIDQIIQRVYNYFMQLQKESNHPNQLQNLLLQSRYKDMIDSHPNPIPIELELPDADPADMRKLDNLVKVVLQFENTYLAALIGVHSEDKIGDIIRSSNYPTFTHICKASWNNIVLAILTKPNVLEIQSRSQYSIVCEMMRKEALDVLRQFLAVMPLLDF